MTTIKQLEDYLISPEGQKNMQAYMKNVKKVMTTFKLSRQRAEHEISEALEYNPENSKELIQIIKGQLTFKKHK